MKSILEIIPQKLWTELPTANGYVDDNGVLVTVIQNVPNNLIADMFSLIRDDKKYYVMIETWMKEDYTQFNWEHVSYKYDDVTPAKSGAISERLDNLANKAELWRNTPRNVMH